MTDERTNGMRPQNDGARCGQALDYEPPRIERVLTSADLERETLYAGRPSGPV
jgi:hypothetical protein